MFNSTKSMFFYIAGVPWMIWKIDIVLYDSVAIFFRLLFHFRCHLTLVLGIIGLCFIISIHLFVEKCYKTCSNENDVENQEISEEVGHLFDIRFFLMFVTYMIFRICLQFFPYQILPLRITFFIKDIATNCFSIMENIYYYFRNSHLRKFVGQNMLNFSYVQSQNDTNEIQLQSIDRKNM